MPAKEDCAARSLVKGELRDEEKVVQLKGNGEDDSLDDEDDVEGMRNESRKEDGKETGNICEPKSNELSKENDEISGEDSETRNSTGGPNSSELSYNERRKKNIEENKRLLEEVMGSHSISESLGKKKTPKERVTKKKARSDEPAVRRELQRNTGKVGRYCFINCDTSGFPRFA